jgi:molecular chaperone GrpE
MGLFDKKPKPKPLEPEPPPAPKAAPKEPERKERNGPSELEIESAQRLLDRMDGIGRLETSVQQILPLLQYMGRSFDKMDRQFVDLRGHFTKELGGLASSLRAEAMRDAAVDLFNALAPALDDLDHVLIESSTEEARGTQTLRIIRRRLREALGKLGIQEIPIEERVTAFDPEVHDGEPYDGSPEALDGLPPGTIVKVARTGYRAGDRLLRSSKVSVAPTR